MFFLIFCNLCNDITPLCTYTLRCIPLPSCVSLQLGVLHIQVMRLYEVQAYHVVRFPGMSGQLDLMSLDTLKGNAVCPEHCIVGHLQYRLRMTLSSLLLGFTPTVLGQLLPVSCCTARERGIGAKWTLLSTCSSCCIACTVKVTMQCRGQLYILIDTVEPGYMIAANCLRGGAGLVHSLRP